MALMLRAGGGMLRRMKYNSPLLAKYTQSESQIINHHNRYQMFACDMYLLRIIIKIKQYQFYYVPYNMIVNIYCLHCWYYVLVRKKLNVPPK
jgi:hypothetical protein